MLVTWILSQTSDQLNEFAVAAQEDIADFAYDMLLNKNASLLLC